MARTYVKSAQVENLTLLTEDIANSQVTYAKIQQVPSGIVLGRVSSGLGDVEELTTLPAGVQSNITQLGELTSDTIYLGGHYLTLTDDLSLPGTFTFGTGTGGRVAEWANTNTLQASNVSFSAVVPVTLAISTNFGLNGVLTGAPSFILGADTGKVSLLLYDGTDSAFIKVYYDKTLTVSDDATVSGTNTGDQSSANPTASVGLTVVNGSAATFMRSDAAPALDVAIIPTWTGVHTFSNTTDSSSTSTGAIHTTGGAGIAKNAWIGGTINLPVINANSLGIVWNSGATQTGILENYYAGSLSFVVMAANRYIDSNGTWSLLNNNAGGSLEIDNDQLIFNTHQSSDASANRQMFLSTGGLIIDATTDSTSSGTGAITTNGGLGVAKATWIGTSLTMPAVVSASTYKGIDFNSGSMRVGSLQVMDYSGGSYLYFSVNRYITDSPSITWNKQNERAGGVISFAANTMTYYSFAASSATPVARFAVNADGNTLVYNTTESDSTSTGALVVSGGVGIAKKLRVGTTMVIASDQGISNIAGLTVGFAGANAGSALWGTYSLCVATGATTTVEGARGAVTTADAAFTVSYLVGLRASVSKGASATVTTAVGLYIDPVTAGGTNYAIYVSAGQSYFTDTTESTSVSSGAVYTLGGMGVTKNLNVGGQAKVLVANSGYLPMVSYGSLGSGITVNSIVCGAAIGYACTLRRMHVNTYVATTNNGSHYWTVALINTSTGATITSFTTASDSADTWYNHAVTGLSTALATTDKSVYIYVTKTGSPGALNVLGTAVYVE